MTRFCLRIAMSFVLCLSLCAHGFAQDGGSGPAWEKIAQIFGKKGTLSGDGVYKTTFPRTDLRVTLNGAPVPVGMGLTSWAAFTRMPDRRYMVMGDTVLLAAEINKVVDALRTGGIEVVAVHNHMAGERPGIYFLHYQGFGEAAALARTIHRALENLRQ